MPLHRLCAPLGRISRGAAAAAAAASLAPRCDAPAASRGAPDDGSGVSDGLHTIRGGLSSDRAPGPTLDRRGSGGPQQFELDTADPDPYVDLSTLHSWDANWDGREEARGARG